MKRIGLVVILMLAGCGKREALDQLKKPTDQASDNQIIQDVQQNPYDLEDRLIMVASLKTKDEDNKKDSVYVDSDYETPEIYHLKLPEIIQASGSPGDDHKLYILFNSTTDCMWTSHNDEDYRNPVCYENAERAPTTNKGFESGKSVDASSLEQVEKLEMRIYSAQGSGKLTTASAIFFKL